jgi:hypothetical protein
MGLFDQILGAIDNPNQQASVGQLSNILSTVQQLSSNQGLNASQTQVLMSTVGSYVRSSLQEQRAAGGSDRVESLINQFAGTQPNAAAVQALLPPTQQQQLAQTVSQKTGLDPSMVQSLLAIAVPVVLNLLSTGASQQQAAPQPGATAASNSVLNAFLDTDGDGDVDMSDTLSMAGRFLSQR